MAKEREIVVERVYGETDAGKNVFTTDMDPTIQADWGFKETGEDETGYYIEYTGTVDASQEVKKPV